MKVENLVSVFLFFSAEFCIVLYPKYAILIDGKPSFDRHFAQPDVVLFASSKVGQSRAVRFLFDYSQVYLQTFFDDYARLGRALHDDFFDMRKMDKDAHHLFGIVGHG